MGWGKRRTKKDSQSSGLSNCVIVITEMWETGREKVLRARGVVWFLTGWFKMPIRHHPGGIRNMVPDLCRSSVERRKWGGWVAPTVTTFIAQHWVRLAGERECRQGKDENQEPSPGALKKLEVRKKKRAQQNIYKRSIQGRMREKQSFKKGQSSMASNAAQTSSIEQIIS